MAIYNQGFDITMKAGTAVKTVTSQYRIVGMCWDSTAADWTAYLANPAGGALEDTTSALGAIGIIQDVPSAGSTEVTVRVLGISKAICAASIMAGAFIHADVTISTTTKCGMIVQGNYATTNLASGQASVASVCLGRCLEDGSTYGVVTIILAPHLISNN